MPIVAIGFVVLFALGVGIVVGGGTGTLAAWLLHLRVVRQREIQGAEERTDEAFSSGCGVLLTGFMLGSVIGCGLILGLGVLVVRLGAE